MLPNLTLEVSVPVPACKVTLLLSSKVDNEDPLILPVLETSKSFGSSSQLPAKPFGASVLILAESPTLKREADVSINPPSPPRLPPLALMLPATSVTLSGLLRSAITSIRPPCPALAGAASALMLPVSSMRSLATKRTTPPSRTRPVALITPVFLTTPACKRLAAWADKMMRPPGASTALPFSTSAAIVAGVTSTLDKLPSLPICSW